MTICDLFPLTNPEWFSSDSIAAFCGRLKDLLRADHIFCISHATRSQLREVFPSLKKTNSFGGQDSKFFEGLITYYRWQAWIMIKTLLKDQFRREDRGEEDWQEEDRPGMLWFPPLPANCQARKEEYRAYPPGAANRKQGTSGRICPNGYPGR